MDTTEYQSRIESDCIQNHTLIKDAITALWLEALRAGQPDEANFWSALETVNGGFAFIFYTSVKRD